VREEPCYSHSHHRAFHRVDRFRGGRRDEVGMDTGINLPQEKS
jgi:hypothetical protein